MCDCGREDCGDDDFYDDEYGYGYGAGIRSGPQMYSSEAFPDVFYFG